MPSVTAVDTRFGYLHCSCQPYMLFMLDITIHSDQDIKYIINKTLQKNWSMANINIHVHTLCT